MDYQETYKGKCITCGFAAKRATLSIAPNINKEYFEIPNDERQQQSTLQFSTYFSSSANASDIACFRGKRDLLSLVKEQVSHSKAGVSANVQMDLRELVSKRVLEETSCECWYQYEPGRTPQEHLSDYMWEQLEKQRMEHEQEREKDRRVFEERLEKDRREFDMRLFESSQKVQIESRQIADSNYRFTKRVTWLVIFLAVLQVSIAVLNLAYPNGWPLLMRVFHNQAQPVEAKPEPVELDMNHQNL